jgi:flagellar basal-body rod modification protein FlgD
MSLIAPVSEGEVSSTTTTTTSTTGTSSLDKNDFLQLLVAQMKYQDPLEPTSNTEYISQYATFSELEEMQNMSSSMDLTRASSLVGQEVVIKSTSDTGDTSYVRGNVDYVQLENGNALLSINDSLYSLDDVYSVADTDYLNAYDNAVLFMNTIDLLPTVVNTTLDDEDTISALREVYDGMSDYEKSFISTDEVEALLESYEDKISELKLAE